jgi:hypothetical protein
LFKMPVRSTAATSNSVISFLHFLHKVFNDVLCVVQTLDNSADSSVLFNVIAAPSRHKSFSLLFQLADLVKNWTK